LSGDVYFQRDIAQALQAVTVAGVETATMSGNTAYWRGFCSAIRMSALVYGIDPRTVLRADDGQRVLLEQ